MQALNFLGALRSKDIDQLFSFAEMRTVLSDGVLIREGQAPEAIYFVTEGLFDVVLLDARGKEVRIDRCAPGTVAGEMSWLDGKPASATIRAAESSAVLAIPTNRLEPALAADPAFAARFYRAVALIASERLRAAHGRTRELEPQRALAVDERLESVQDRLLAAISEFKEFLMVTDQRAIENNGVIPIEFRTSVREKFRQLFMDLNDAIGDNSALTESSREALGAIAKRDLLPLICLTETAERFYSKPRGYAGDYFTIELIYRNEPKGTGRIGPLLDECFLTQPGPQAARNRRNLLANEILGTCAAHPGRQVNVTSLACGPAREIFDAFERLNDSSVLNVTGVDIDQEALELLRVRCIEYELSDRVTGVHGNIIYMATGRQDLALPPQDLVYSIGLIDYFNDEFVVKLMDWIYDLLRPGGRVILGNFHPRNPDKAAMDYVLDWRLIHRDEAKMDELYQRSQFGRGSTQIKFEEEGINLFAECVK